MQDIHSVTGGGGGGRLFTGVGGGGGDRRLRPHHHHGNGPQALKCPRCESLNTKFCYYNNYNLSQPRHFCKSCRRYWTKGGVLRNVPVGGGCRKTKRSKPKSGSNKNPTSSDNNKKSSTSQNSSSESSSLTATTTAAVVNPTTTAVPVTPVSSSSTMMNFPETSTGFFTNPSFEAPPVENNNLFTELGSFTGLINSTQQLPVEFNNSTGISPFRLHQTGSNVENSPVNQNQWNNIQTDHIIEEELKLPETGSLGFAGLVEKTGVGIGTEDWNNNGCTDQALFDLTGAVDQSYWSQTWDDHGHDDGHDHHHHHQLNYLP